MLAQGKGHDVEVRAVAAKLLECEPGRILVASFVVTNTGANAEEFIETLDLPENWQIVTAPISFILEPRQSRARVIAFHVPLGAPAGRYDVTYSVRSQRDYAIQDTDTVAVVVLPTKKLALMLEYKPHSVIAGDQYEVTFRVINQGNSESAVRIQCTSDQDYPVRLSADEAVLASAGTLVVTATVKTDRNAAGPIKNILQIRAWEADADKDKDLAALTVLVDVIPISGYTIDPYLRLPTKFKFTATNQASDTGFQAQFAGRGAIGDSGNASVDFLLRAPDIQDISFYGERDEYRLNYYSPGLDLLSGDQTYALSPLTEYYRYGRGLGVNYGRGRGVGAGAFFLTSRWSSPEEREFGAYVSGRTSDRAQWKINLLNKNASGASGFSDKLWSAQADLRPYDDAQLELEYGRCTSDRGGQSTDDAYRASLTGTLGESSYTFETIHAGPDYFGYYSDSDFANGTVTFPIAGGLRAYMSAQKWKQNLRLDPSRHTAPSETFYQAGVRYMWSSGSQASLDYNFFSRRDLLHPSGCNFKEAAVRAGYGRSFGKSAVQLHLESGTQRDLVTNRTLSANRYSLYFYIRSSDRQYFTAYAEVGDRRIESSHLLGNVNTVGASAFWKPLDNLSLRLHYATHGLGQSKLSRIDQLYFTAQYGRPDEVHWDLRFRRVDRSLTGSDSGIMVSWVIPWGIPVGKKKDLGTIRGKVYDADDPARPGMPRAVVSVNGAAAVTDEKGEFVLRNIPPGVCPLVVDRNSIGLDRIAGIKLPVVVDVKAGEPANVEIPVTRPSSLVGDVVVFASRADHLDSEARGDGIFVEGSGENGSAGGYQPRTGSGPDQDGLLEAGRLGNVLVELTGDSEVLRRLTDDTGKFAFEDLTPGIWKLKVYDYNLPMLHRLDSPDRELHLAPGSKKEIVVRILPVRRPVKIIQRGTIASDEGE